MLHFLAHPCTRWVQVPLSPIELMADLNMRAERSGLPLWSLVDCERILLEQPQFILKKIPIGEVDAETHRHTAQTVPLPAAQSA